MGTVYWLTWVPITPRYSMHPNQGIYYKPSETEESEETEQNDSADNDQDLEEQTCRTLQNNSSNTHKDSYQAEFQDQVFEIHKFDGSSNHISKEEPLRMQVDITHRNRSDSSSSRMHIRDDFGKITRKANKSENNRVVTIRSAVNTKSQDDVTKQDSSVSECKDSGKFTAENSANEMTTSNGKFGNF